MTQWQRPERKGETITRADASENKGPSSAHCPPPGRAPIRRALWAKTPPLFSFFPSHSFCVLRFPSFPPSLDDMHFSTIFKLSALLSTAAVQVTAAQFNVTVGGSAGLMFTPQTVVRDVQCFCAAVAEIAFIGRTTGRYDLFHLSAKEPHCHSVHLRQPMPTFRGRL
jgi:hypothetical protein